MSPKIWQVEKNFTFSLLAFYLFRIDFHNLLILIVVFYT